MNPNGWTPELVHSIVEKRLLQHDEMWNLALDRREQPPADSTEEFRAGWAACQGIMLGILRSER